MHVLWLCCSCVAWVCVRAIAVHSGDTCRWSYPDTPWDCGTGIYAYRQTPQTTPEQGKYGSPQTGRVIFFPLGRRSIFGMAVGRSIAPPFSSSKLRTIFSGSSSGPCGSWRAGWETEAGSSTGKSGLGSKGTDSSLRIRGPNQCENILAWVRAAPCEVVLDCGLESSLGTE